MTSIARGYQSIMRDVIYLVHILLVVIAATCCEPTLAIDLKETVQNVQKQLQSGAEKARQAVENANNAAQAERQKELDALSQSKTQAESAAQTGNYSLAVELLRGGVRVKMLTGRNPLLADCYDELSAYEKLQANAELKKHFSPIPLSWYPIVIYGGLACFALCWAPIIIAQVVSGALGLFAVNKVFNWMSAKTWTLASLGTGLIGLGCSYAVWGIYQPLEPIQQLLRESNSHASKAEEIRSNTSALEEAPESTILKNRQKVTPARLHAHHAESEVAPTEQEARRKHRWTLPRLKHDHNDQESSSSSDDQLQTHHKWWYHANK